MSETLQETLSKHFTQTDSAELYNAARMAALYQYGCIVPVSVKFSYGMLS